MEENDVSEVKMQESLSKTEETPVKGWRGGNRWPNKRKDHTTKHPGGYVTPKIKKWLAQQIYPHKNLDTGEIEKISGYDAIALNLVKLALQKDVRAIEVLLDRLEGKVSQKVENEIKVVKMGDVIVNNKPLELDVDE